MTLLYGPGMDFRTSKFLTEGPGGNCTLNIAEYRTVALNYK